MDALKNEMRLSNRPIQCIDVRSINMLNDGKRLIVAFVSELALRSPSLSQASTRARNVILCLFLRYTFLGIKIEFGLRTCDVPLVIISKRKRHMHYKNMPSKRS